MSIYTTRHTNPNLIYKLRNLGMAGAVLHVGAHPDDEDFGLMVYAAHKLGVRTVYWSATRGEGGQNRIGPYRDSALGVYRTWEGLAARAADGGESLFGPFIDFGYSKNGEEALAKWGHDDVVREIVRAIRMAQPQIVIARWTGGPDDRHGQHEAIGQATVAAFNLAGDPNQYPELRAQGLAAWQPGKLYQSLERDWQPGEDSVMGEIVPEYESEGYVRIDTGEFDPIAGRTYQEQAWMAFNCHQTQAMGFVPERGSFYYYYALVKSLVPDRGEESGFHDGLDSTLTGLADYPAEGSDTLRAALEEVKAHAQAALDQFRGDDPLLASRPVLQGLSLLRRLRDSLKEEKLSEDAARALDAYLKRKIVDFETVAAECLGLRLEGLSDNARITPGQQFHVLAQLWNHRDVQIGEPSFALHLPGGWKVRSVQSVHVEAGALGDACANYEVTSSPGATLACPYWMVDPPSSYKYSWPDGDPCGLPFGPAIVEVECTVQSDEFPLMLRAPVVLRQAFAGGYRELPVAVLPPISLHPKTGREFLQVRGKRARRRREVRSRQELQKIMAFLADSAADQHLELQVVARNNSEQVAEGRLELVVPPGWSVSPDKVDLVLAEGDAQNMRFTVIVPADTPAGHYPLQYKVRCGGRDYEAILEPVRMGAPGIPRIPDEAICIKEEFVTAPAVVNVCLLDVNFVRGLNYAYVQGASEEILEALAHFDLAFHLITDEEMGYLDLSQFDAIVIGPNAYLIRDELRKNATRFLRYVEQGGTLIVQYQGYGYQNQGFAPYPFRYNQPHDRVTFQDAPVAILAPDHALANLPNGIVAADFDDWVHDRGLYFFGECDQHYQPILVCSDPGEEPRRGGLLVAGYGQGTYLYTGYSFFRQLPAGVPGAFRLFANILALPMARVLERVELLECVSLFSFMDEDQLEAVARIMSERRIEDGMYLCHQGDEGGELYVVAQGEVEIIKEAGGKGRVIAVHEKGECIGEMAVLADIPRAAAMRARGDVRLFVIESAHFQSLMRQHPEISDRVIQVLVEKLAARED